MVLAKQPVIGNNALELLFDFITLITLQMVHVIIVHHYVFICAIIDRCFERHGSWGASCMYTLSLNSLYNLDFNSLTIYIN